MRKSIIIPVVVILLIVLAALFFLASIYRPELGGAEKVIFKVEKGENIKKVASRLEDAGIIGNKFFFEFYSYISGKRKIVAGDHSLAKNMDIVEVIDELNSSKNLNKERSITIIEGWNISDIASYLEDQGVISSTDFLQAVKLDNWKDKYDFLSSAKGDSLEGFLFPDTYRIFKDATADDIIKKMLDNFDHKFDASMRSDVLSQNKSIFEIVTMASIIEKEAKFSQDRKMVSDIFWKRIDIGMALQSDATVNYITKAGDIRPHGKDLEVDSLYNTYKYRGLTPGPISNPGLSSISAALYPIKNDYYYFLTDKSGHAVFAKTFDGHKVNISKYLD